MPHHTDTLTTTEADSARALALLIGTSRAAQQLGLDPRTLAFAIARLPVDRLTVVTLRSRLPSRI